VRDGCAPARGKHREPRSDERGVALLVAVLATALLTVTVLEFTYSSQVAYRRAAHWLEAERARLAAESGVALAAEVLSFDGELAELVAGANLPEGAAGMLQGLDPRLAGVDGAVDLWARCAEPGPWTCSQRVGAECTLPLSMTAMSDTTAIPVDPSGSFTVRIEDETGLYNLNRLSTHLVPNEFERVVRLFRLAGADAAVVGPIVDWLDSDSTPLAYPPGAEASQYAADGRVVPPRNAPLATFRELALVLGVDAETLRRVRAIATVLPAPVDKINVNTAPLPVLQSLSDAFDDESILAALHAQRCVQPFLDEADLKARLPEIERTGALPMLTYSSSWFRVRSTAHVGDATQSVEALLFRKGARIDPAYLLAQRGANVVDVEEPDGEAFDLDATDEEGRS
jgi:type II secretory pathway component PulK